MIIGHEIKYVDSNEILIIKLDYSYEISGGKASSLKEQLLSYIKNNNIVFNGTKVIFQIFGIALASLTLSSSSIKNNQSSFLNTLINNDYSVSLISENKKDNNVQSTITNDSNNDSNNIQQKNNEIDNNTSKDITSAETNTVVSSNTSAQSNQTNLNQPLQIEQSNENVQVQTENHSNKTYVTVYRANGSILNIELEEYLIGVVGAEMPASFNEEALKAQAILCRTYALKSIKTNKKITDTVSTQAYKDNDELKSLWNGDYNKYYNKIKQAVDSTKGKVIMYNGDYIDALYHSTSNGKTEYSSNVFSYQYPYLVSVDSSYDKNASSYLRQETKNYSDVLNILGISTEDTSFEIISRNESGRVSQIRIGNKIFSGTQFRNILGLRSADFDLSLNDNVLTITTRGYGHGVGMSQYGADAMAKAGYSYQDIILHYYQGVTIY